MLFKPQLQRQVASGCLPVPLLTHFLLLPLIQASGLPGAGPRHPEQHLQEQEEVECVQKEDQ